MSYQSNITPQPLEHWPLSDYTSQRQIEEWSQDDDNAELYAGDEASRAKFLNFKRDHLSWDRSELYFRKLGVPIKGRILEQGAGCFWLSSYLSSFETVEEVVGVELSESRILAFRDVSLKLFSKSRPEKIRYVVGDMHRIDVADGTFDIVTCDAVLHHADNLVGMLRESWRALKPGGWFVALREPTISKHRKEPIFNSRYPEDGTAMYYYEDGWRSAFINAWYVNVQTIPFLEYGTVRGRRMPWAARRMLRAVDNRAHVYPKICVAGQKPA
jgi:ubiquinone/menaquinone biosynthesis C-methylase UbiE